MRHSSARAETHYMGSAQGGSDGNGGRISSSQALSSGYRKRQESFAGLGETQQREGWLVDAEFSAATISGWPVGQQDDYVLGNVRSPCKEIRRTMLQCSFPPPAGVSQYSLAQIQLPQCPPGFRAPQDLGSDGQERQKYPAELAISLNCDGSTFPSLQGIVADANAKYYPCRRAVDRRTFCPRLTDSLIPLCFPLSSGSFSVVFPELAVQPWQTKGPRCAIIHQCNAVSKNGQSSTPRGERGGRPRCSNPRDPITWGQINQSKSDLRLRVEAGFDSNAKNTRRINSPYWQRPGRTRQNPAVSERIYATPRRGPDDLSSQDDNSAATLAAPIQVKSTCDIIGLNISHHQPGISIIRTGYSAGVKLNPAKSQTREPHGDIPPLKSLMSFFKALKSEHIHDKQGFPWMTLHSLVLEPTVCGEVHETACDQQRDSSRYARDTMSQNRRTSSCGRQMRTSIAISKSTAEVASPFSGTSSPSTFECVLQTTAPVQITASFTRKMKEFMSMNSMQRNNNYLPDSQADHFLGMRVPDLAPPALPPSPLTVAPSLGD
ncbi:hypothetical protein HPP92_029088 [Vanilla planifolia]|uniref:Uncharacterized protein n=1 Tax=Vanilla planifolia TaxID=51239 RepID=A0A835P8H6_VANPL|nr:hypothetical protein HPP92_029077 [Vanilla planifolia]KAG0445947.1 hypothetical protein HPP92_029088 [Vanilla planifolia]